MILDPYRDIIFPLLINNEQKKKREKDDWKKFCKNIGGKFVPVKEWCPTIEIYDELMKAIEKEKTASKKDTMSNVSRRYY